MVENCLIGIINDKTYRSCQRRACKTPLDLIIQAKLIISISVFMSFKSNTPVIDKTHQEFAYFLVFFLSVQFVVKFPFKALISERDAILDGTVYLGENI